jgi:hypothetical protein
MAIDRERKVDVSKMSPDQADSLAIQIGEKIKQITEKAVAEANHFLNIYGMSCKMQIVFDSQEVVVPEAPVKSQS